MLKKMNETGVYMEIEKGPFDKQIGRRIRELREYQHLTREKLAEYADTSVQFIADIECGRKGMTTYTLYKLAEALHVSTDYIIYGKEKEVNSTKIAPLLDNLDIQHQEIAERILQLYIQAINQ